MISAMIKFDVTIDKMAILMWGLQRLWQTVFEINVDCSFLHMEPGDDKVFILQPTTETLMLAYNKLGDSCN